MTALLSTAMAQSDRLAVLDHPADVLKDQRGPIKAGFYADFIGVPGDPLQDMDAVRNVQFVMKNGDVVKRNGLLTIDKLLHPGPVNGFRRR